MTQIVVRDDRELRRIEKTITDIEHTSRCSNLHNEYLLIALKAERDELLRIAGRTGRLRRRTAQAA